jgi:hypothetical protein
VVECGPFPVFASFKPGVCLTTEEKARKNLSQGKKNLSQVKENLSQVKENLSQSTFLKYKIGFTLFCFSVPDLN